MINSSSFFFISPVVDCATLAAGGKKIHSKESITLKDQTHAHKKKKTMRLIVIFQDGTERSVSLLPNKPVSSLFDAVQEIAPLHLSKDLFVEHTLYVNDPELCVL